VIEEDAQNGTPQNEYLYLGRQRIARVYQLFTGPYYYYGDNLGTSRVIADENGNMCYDADYFPWGGEQYVFTNTCPQNYKFNGKERDPDMGIDDFGARFYQDSMGRFYSPDWSATVEPVPYAKLNNPQSLNLYTYVLDNPLSLRDVDGHNFNGPWQPGAGGCQQNNGNNPACSSDPCAKDPHCVTVTATPLGPPPTAISVWRGLLQRWQRIDWSRILQGLQQGLLFSPFGELDIGAEGVEEGLELAEEAAASANKVNHIFGNAAHNLDPLVSEFGSQQAAYNALKQATQAAVAQQRVTGVFEISVKVGSQNVTVRGAVVNGVAEIGTAFK